MYCWILSKWCPWNKSNSFAEYLPVLETSLTLPYIGHRPLKNDSKHPKLRDFFLFNIVCRFLELRGIFLSCIQQVGCYIALLTSTLWSHVRSIWVKKSIYDSSSSSILGNSIKFIIFCEWKIDNIFNIDGSFIESIKCFLRAQMSHLHPRDWQFLYAKKSSKFSSWDSFATLWDDFSILFAPEEGRVNAYIIYFHLFWGFWK